VEDESLLRSKSARIWRSGAPTLRGADTFAGCPRFLADPKFRFRVAGREFARWNAVPSCLRKSTSRRQRDHRDDREGGVNGAVEAMRLGALDYLVKPFDLAELPLVIGGHARRNKRRASMNIAASRRRERAFFFGGSLAALENQLEKKIIAADNRMQERLSPVSSRAKRAQAKPPSLVGCTWQGPRTAQPAGGSQLPACPKRWPNRSCSATNVARFTTPGPRAWDCFEAANGGTLFLTSCRACPSGSKPRCSCRLKTGKSGAGWHSRIPWTRGIVAAAIGI